MSQNSYTKENFNNGLPGQGLINAGLNVFGLQLFIESYTDHENPPPLKFRYLGVDVSFEIPAKTDEKEQSVDTELQNICAECGSEVTGKSFTICDDCGKQLLKSA